jgi:hypothetical protein
MQKLDKENSVVGMLGAVGALLVMTSVWLVIRVPIVVPPVALFLTSFLLVRNRVVDARFVVLAEAVVAGLLVLPSYSSASSSGLERVVVVVVIFAAYVIACAIGGAAGARSRH